MHGFYANKKVNQLHPYNITELYKMRLNRKEKNKISFVFCVPI